MKTTITLLIFFSIQLCAGIGIGYSAAGSLPVELTSFTANQGSGNVDLYWVTATEVNNFGYEIERANAVKEAIWEKIGFISGHGNSISPNNYSFKDNKPLSGKSQYRLKQIDQVGVFKYSNTVEVAAVILKYDLAQNYPNPFNPSTLITYSIPTSSNVIVTVFNMLGELIKTLVNENQEAGIYKVNFDAGSLSNGVYFYKIQAGNFASTKKMLLLK
ncbi:MAG: T9SS type A sorting domain-containing protein [Ignavibacteriaceae bacterium]|nr:T9SS type A sorting domain-containing protein [Ignavibacteriaceae bacterium]